MLPKQALSHVYTRLANDLASLSLPLLSRKLRILDFAIQKYDFYSTEEIAKTDLVI